MMFEQSGVGVFDAGVFSTENRISHREIDRNLRRLAKADRELTIEIGRWFLIAKRTEAHRPFGYASFFEYVQRVFGMGVRAAEERLRVAAELETMPAIAAAIGCGGINFSVARDLTRIATPAIESVWLEAARGLTAKEVREMCRGRVRGDLPTDPKRPELDERELSLTLTAHVYGTFFEARRALEDRLGHRLTDAETIDVMCREVLEGGGNAPSNKPPYQVALTVCTQCEKTWQDSAGETIEVPASVRETAECDCEYLGHADAETPERVTSEIPLAIRRLVLARDHHRCTVPGCRSHRVLHIHHIKFRGHGGDHSLCNLTTLCHAHHTALHEGGHLLIRGSAPGGLEFLHADGRPYGAEPECVSTEPPESSTFDDALSALTTLGFKSSVARAAIERACAHVCGDAPLEELIRAALKECAH